MQTDESTPVGVSFQRNIYDCMLSYLPADKEARILDVGGGQGYFSQLARDNGYTQVEVADFAEADFKAQGIPFHAIDLNRRLPFDDDSYDWVVTIEVAEHVENHDNYVSELLRILKPGGHLVFSTPNVQSIPSRIHYFFYGHSDGARRPFPPELESFETHVNCINVQAILYYVEHHGGVVEKMDTNRYRRSATPLAILYPFFMLAFAFRFFRKKYRERWGLYRTYISFSLSPALLFGRLLIVDAKKLPKD